MITFREILFLIEKVISCGMRKFSSFTKTKHSLSSEFQMKEQYQFLPNYSKAFTE